MDINDNSSPKVAAFAAQGLSDQEILRQVEQEQEPPLSKTPIIAFCIALTACLMVTALAVGRFHPSSPASPSAHSSTPRWVNWTYSFEEAQMRAKTNHQKIFIDFYTDWCPACKWMDSNVYTQPEVLAESANVVTVKINAEGRPDLAKRYNIHVYPSLVWTDENGGELSRNDGSLRPDELAERMKQTQ